MRTIELYKAQPLDRGVDSLTVVIEESFPKFPTPSYVADSTATFENDARSLAAALQETLPGGTFHALAVELLRRQINLHVVADTKEDR